jgi:hypothetical protein
MAIASWRRKLWLGGMKAGDVGGAVSSLTTTLLEEVQVHYWKKCQFTITVAKAMVVSALDDVDLEPE